MYRKRYIKITVPFLCSNHTVFLLCITSIFYYDKKVLFFFESDKRKTLQIAVICQKKSCFAPFSPVTALLPPAIISH